MKQIPLILALLFALCGISLAQLPTPALRDGQYVYTIPSNFDPPLIGQSGIDDLNGAARRCRYPFYVVLVRDLPGSGDGDKRAANAVNALAEEWGQRYPSFDMAKSQIFLLAYNPKKYRFLAGSKFESELGFRSDAHKPYTSIFDRSVQSQRKDPKNGIINMMEAVDEFLFDQTDPARIAARTEAARQQEEQKRLVTAQSTLNGQIEKLSELLSDQRFVPSNTAGYKKSLETAKAARQRNDPIEMSSVSQALKPDIATLETFVNDKMSQARNELVKTIFFWIIGIGALLFLLSYLFARANKLRVLREEFDDIFKKRTTATTNAAQQFFALYGDRGDILSLTGITGKSLDLYHRVTRSVDEIFLGVEALRQHAETYKRQADTATYFNLDPLTSAIESMSSEFEFDTGVVNKSDLFEPETKVIRVNPTELTKSLQAQFEKAVDGWEELKAAIAARGTTAESAFPSSNLDELHKQADELRIPKRWLSGHPLAGDETDDQSLYARVNALSWDDPIAFNEEIAALKAKEAAVIEQIKRLVAAVKLVSTDRLEAEPNIANTVVDPNDNPVATFALARRAEDKLAGVLASAKTVEEVEEHAKTVNSLYRKTAEQAATIKSAVGGAESSITKADAKLAQAKSQFAAASGRLQEARQNHVKVEKGFLTNAEALIQEAGRDLDKAKRQLAERRHLNARNNADRATEKLGQAIDQAKRSVRHCDELDEKKAEYQKRLASIDSVRRSLQGRISQYGGSANLARYRADTINGPADYVTLLLLLDRTEQKWENEALKAQRAYEEAERQRLEEEAARRRAEEDEDRRRRQSSYESSSSSWGSSDSGSSWGGGSDSSSGGSWGGGGDSSSGGSW
ncbi:MAG: hypothetical protein HZB70_00985 [Candidatus Berkelbacteria bacterium]|nr:MAG: hypothetical protein HZB70_00985 [Candidatus Berkelbacteria bacterium]QQG52086.1 MAG: hypothetical protein HY845_02010 [Candidatus Berkelbacteria bacterium]